MNDEEIERQLENLVKILKSENVKSKQFAFNKNIVAIENCISEGVPLKKICDVLNSLTDSQIKFAPFKTMLARARAKKSENKKSIKTPEKKHTPNFIGKDNPLLALSKQNDRKDDYNPTPDKHRIYGDDENE